MTEIPTDYEETTPHRAYRCSKCDKHGTKLWRQYSTFVDNVRLLCGSCALADQKKEGPVDEEGRIAEPILGGRRCDPIGWLVPAIPTEEGDTFWGYTSVPEKGVRWWRRLPTEERGEGAGK